MATKKHLFHILNERARQKEWQEGKGSYREEEKYQDWATDPRKSQGVDMTRNYPLIEDE